MEKRVRVRSAALGVGMMSLAFLLVGVDPVGAEPKPHQVEVINTNANPVPVTGSTTISGSVGILGTPGVIVGNPVAAPVLQRNVDAGTFTHAGQKASRHVLLQYFLGCSCFRRIFPDGSLESGGFGIPNGQALVVTDVDWSLASGTAGHTASMVLALSGGQFVVVDSRAAFNSDGLGGRSEHLTGGRVLSVLPTPFFQNTLNNLVLSGYLVPDE